MSDKKVKAKAASAKPAKKSTKVKVENVVFRVRTFANGEVWANTKYGTYKAGAVGEDKFDAIVNCANWANKMIAMRKVEAAKKTPPQKSPPTRRANKMDE